MDSDAGDSQKIWENIVKIAQEDGHITPEESNLISTILENAKRYSEVLEKALEDNKITKDEKQELIELRANILDGAYRQASKDQKITQDELAIIKETLQILHDLELSEDNYQ